MVLSWSRAIYVEFVRRADVATFMRCHVNAFHYFGGVPRRCLYDNAKVVVLGRDVDGRPEWNSRMLDFSLRVGLRDEAVPAVPRSDQGQGGERGQVRPPQPVAHRPVQRRFGHEQAGDGVV